MASLAAFLITFFIFWLLLMAAGFKLELALGGAFIIAVLIGLLVGGSKQKDLTIQDVEEVAMDLAMRYERMEGRESVDVSEENRGYDIISEGRWGDIRYIEVRA